MRGRFGRQRQSSERATRTATLPPSTCDSRSEHFLFFFFITLKPRVASYKSL